MNPLVVFGVAAAAYYYYKTRSGNNNDLPDSSTAIGTDKLHPDTEQNSVSNVGGESPNATKGRHYGHQSS
jgi:hypothetical protein